MLNAMYPFGVHISKRKPGSKLGSYSYYLPFLMSTCAIKLVIKHGNIFRDY